MITYSVYEQIKIPDGENLGAQIVNFEITEKEVQWALMRQAFRRDHAYDRPPMAGKHIRLVVGGETMMSDTEMEKSSNLNFIYKAKGDVLIAGLGIGLIIKPIINKPEITSVTVIEKHAGVITLVAPHVAHPKLTIVQADIFTWKTKRNFDTIYFDIWPNITTSNLKDIATLNRRFARRLKPGGWRGAWLESSLRQMRARDR